MAERDASARPTGRGRPDEDAARLAIAALRESEQRFQAVFDNAALGILRLGPRGEYLESNPALQHMLGYSAAELALLDPTVLLHPDDRERVVRQFVDLLDEITAGTNASPERRPAPTDRDPLDVRHLRKDGSVLWTQVTISLVRGSAGEPLFYIGMVQDITLRRQAEVALRASEHRYRSLLQNISDIVALLDANGAMQYLSPSFERFWGIAPEKMLGLNFFQGLHPDDEAAVRAVFRAVAAAPASIQAVELRRPGFDGEYRHFEAILSNRLDDPDIGGIVVNTREITERKRAEAALRHQALHDALTGLPNRTLLQDRLDQAVRGARRDGTPLALLFLDLDRFKDVNDTFGHHIGDWLLQQGAGRLRGAVRAVDTVARLGGDEFAVLLPNTGHAGAHRVAEKIVQALGVPYSREGLRLSVGTSAGIAIFPDHGADTAGLMRNADVAMYVAKRSGGGIALYSADDDRKSREQLQLVEDLREALEQGRLELHYQPLLALPPAPPGTPASATPSLPSATTPASLSTHASASPPRLEALARWQHPRHGFIPPEQFVPLAEQSGMVALLNEFVLNTALRQCAAWRTDGLDLGVAVNISSRGLHDPALPGLLRTLLTRYALPASSLTLEITETGIMANPQLSPQVLQQVHEAGIRLSLDNFGTGYSSLSQLARLPVDEIKIDRTSVLRMLEDPHDAAIVRSSIELAHNLGRQAVAVGIENAATLAQITALGCDLAQGHLLGRPMPAGHLPAWLAGP